jgi:hypothetical protein
MLQPIFTTKDFECPSCGAQGMIIKPRVGDSFCFGADKFRNEMRNGAPEIVCIKCDAPADAVLRSGYN